MSATSASRAHLTSCAVAFRDVSEGYYTSLPCSFSSSLSFTVLPGARVSAALSASAFESFAACVLAQVPRRADDRQRLARRDVEARRELGQRLQVEDLAELVNGNGERRASAHASDAVRLPPARSGLRILLDDDSDHLLAESVHLIEQASSHALLLKDDASSPVLLDEGSGVESRPAW